ncbi:MAG: Nif3-like dinuclear metal center hexameric protein [Actinobacteria bacterium]|nr:Nif3-like dinuclear metal center hexameric protein [Actinomycetota bacterium]MCG2806758.1 Nif3-like dinuclear metal center hexameric protein [Coriobacteriia bacterium]
MSQNLGPKVKDIVAALDTAFPTQWAEPWDNVGLAVGDPAAQVTGVLVCLDVTREAVSRAAEQGLNVLVTHHPAFLDPAAAFGSGSVATLALRQGIALIAAHTNLDRAPGGAGSLPAALGLDPGVPLERSLQPMALVTVYAPIEGAKRVREAMAAAGAGRIGLYEGCSFSSEGEGHFEPLAGAAPVVGVGGFLTQVPEERIEMVCSPGLASAVARAAVDAHPYEEPLVVVSEIRIARGVARLGRVCDPSAPGTLGQFAQLVSARLRCVPRVWGDAERQVFRIATATGSAGSLISDAIDGGADVLVAGEVRYHDALAAVESGLAVIEAGHDVTEWPLVPVLSSAIEHVVGSDVRMVIDAPSRGWWTPQEAL